MNLREPYKILFLLFVVLGVYYPGIFAGANSLDDVRMLYSFENGEYVLDLKSLFLPNGFYYRPLVFLTFFLDKWLWNVTPMFMHVENILIHAANTILVFYIAKRFFTRVLPGAGEWPLLCALFFGMHPINTESVNWISGRTDLLATFFILLTTLLLMAAAERNNYASLTCGLGTFILAAMSKEVAILFLPVASLILLFWPPPAEGKDRGRTVRERLIPVFLFTLPFLLLAMVFATLALGRPDKASAGLFGHIMARHSIAGIVQIIFQSLGFYVKKLFIPAPLNFSIAAVSEYYFWPGVLVLFLGYWIAMKRLRLLFPFLAAIILIAPAIVVAILGCAWTPFAERYAYMASAFFSIGLTGLLLLCFRGKNKTGLITVVAAALLVSATTLTAQRNVVWQNNKTLYEDTLAKSPNFSPVHNDAAIALMEEGDYEGATAQLEKGIQTAGDYKNRFLFYINLARIKLSEKDPEAARSIICQTFSSKDSAHPEVLKFLAMIDETRLQKETDMPEEEAQSIRLDLLDTYQELYSKSGNPLHIYRGGQVALSINDTARAASLFREAARLAPPDAHFRDAAAKLAARLSAN